MIRRFAAALAALGLLAACSSSSGAAKSPSYDGEGLDPAQPRPSFVLTDTAGKPFPFGTRTQGHPTLLYFGYTHCPDVCPETMADVGLALAKVPAALARKTYVVFVTTDVKRDSSPVIKRWLSNFSNGSKATWVGLRGTQAQIDAAQAAAHVLVAEDDGETHSAELLLYGDDDYAHVAYLLTDEKQQQAAIAHDLPLVAEH